MNTIKNRLQLLATTFLLLFAAACGDPEPVATCNDGILNQDETALDCGGICDACPTCTDSIQNQGEFRVDCGGPCPACQVTVPCSPDTNTWTIIGLPTMSYTTASVSRDVLNNVVYTISRPFNYQVSITFSQFYTFTYGAEFQAVQVVDDDNGGTLQVAIRIDSGSLVYFISSGTAYVNVLGNSISVAICNGVTYNSFFSTFSTGQVFFTKMH